MIKQYKPETPDQIFNEYKHFVGIGDIDEVIKTPEKTPYFNAGDESGS